MRPHGKPRAHLGYPFLPLFLSRELNISDPTDLAFWTGIAAGATGASLVVAGPLWGAVADRFGGKAMLLRALAGSGIFIGLLGFASGPLDVVVLRFLFGAVTGVVPISAALVAAGTPRVKAAWALGLVSAAFAIGSALGPTIGGIMAPVTGVRGIFIAGGLALLATTVFAALAFTGRQAGPDVLEPGPRDGLGRAPRSVQVRLASLFLASLFLWMGFTAIIPMVGIRILELARSEAAAMTGASFGLMGLLQAGAALGYARPVERVGYRPVAFLGIALYLVAILFAATATVVGTVVVATCLVGLGSGLLLPILSTQLGLAAPRGTTGRVYGISSSMVAIGIAVGPAVAGVVAASAGTAAGLATATIPLLVVAGALALVKEPSA